MLVCMRQNDEGIVEAHWKGAAEIILGLCKRFVDERGEIQEMTPEKVLHAFRLGV
jgi:Ca2+-transporting ATPase